MLQVRTVTEHEADLKTQKRGVVTSLSYEFLQWCEENHKPLNLDQIREWQTAYRKGRKPASYYDQQSAASLKLQLEYAQQRAEKIAAALSRKAPEPTPIITAKRRGRPPKVRD